MRHISIMFYVVSVYAALLTGAMITMFVMAEQTAMIMGAK